jgi:hypothetical protein
MTLNLSNIKRDSHIPTKRTSPPDPAKKSLGVSVKQAELDVMILKASTGTPFSFSKKA